MRQRGIYMFLAVGVFAGATCARAEDVGGDAFSAEDLAFFETRVRPVLAENCYGCHSHDAKRLKGGFYLDSRAGILDAVLAEPGKPDESHLIEAVRYDNPTYAMPPEGKLPDEVIADLERWVAMGLPWPEEAAPGDGGGAEVFDLEARRRSHWAWQQPERSEGLPEVEGLDDSANVIDRFIEARLDAEGIEPGPEADRATLVRRVTLDLTGLPPTPEEVDAFVRDDSPDAYEMLVDRLLASPRFGETWTRHWLDLMRYAEGYGHEFDYNIPHAWKYRDYVIRAINDDVPYDRFVQEHIAGDLIEPRIHDQTEVNEAIKATAWWFFHEQTHAPTDVRQHEAERIDNQLDVMSKSFLGMTVACARCHDHKFDAISDEDYYALAGYLQSSRQQEAYLDPGGRIAAGVEQINERAANGHTNYAALDRPVLEPTKIEHDKSELFEDFNDGSYEGWRATGWAWGDQPTVAGQWDVNSGSAVAVLPGVAHSGMLGPATVGTLRSPEFDFAGQALWLRVRGKGQARVIVDSYTMARHNGLLFEGLDVQIDTRGKWQWLRIAPQRDLYDAADLHRAHLEVIDDHTDAYLEIDEVRFGDRDAPPSPAEPDPSANGASDSSERFAEFTRQIHEIGSKLPQPERVLAITDGSGEDSYVHIRGAYRNVGETMPRRFLTALGGEEMSTPDSGSGREDLAEAMTRPDNPLTARVQVNRIWHHLFGVGIAPTVDNLGYLGLPPSHPALLDHLAVMFVEDDQWSNKAMIKRIVMSRAYRRSSDKLDSSAEQQDPRNVLLHRQNIRRLTGEGIRDSILFAAGSLREQLYGPPVGVYLTEFMQGRGRPKSGPLDGNGRRSIYISVRRNFLSPMMLTFDVPIPFSTVGQRNRSNVPAQALTLMNDPFVHHQAQKWAQHLVAQEHASMQERIDHIFETAMGRPPEPLEREAAISFIEGEIARLGIPEQNKLSDMRPWTALCHAMFNTKGFLYIR